MVMFLPVNQKRVKEHYNSHEMFERKIVVASIVLILLIKSDGHTCIAHATIKEPLSFQIPMHVPHHHIWTKQGPTSNACTTILYIIQVAQAIDITTTITNAMAKLWKASPKPIQT